MKDIEEMIADAKAEEEVAREQAKAVNNTNDFREELKVQLAEAFKPKKSDNVVIDLDEYVALNNKAMDLDRILNAIVDGLELNYNKEKLRYNGGSDLADVIRILYPDAYNALYAAELKGLK